MVSDDEKNSKTEPREGGGTQLRISWRWGKDLDLGSGNVPLVTIVQCKYSVYLD